MAYFDTIIIGGGAAGIMAALSAKRSHPDSKVLILDRTFALGRKILVSGAGRCNLTNSNLGQIGWRKYFHSDSPELPDKVFARFGYQQILDFFSDLGIAVYRELKNNSGKIFPITDSAKNVVALLVDELQRSGVEVLLEHEVVSAKVVNNTFELNVKNGSKLSLFQSKNLILAAGGKTYPALGANGSGYSLAQGFGHAVMEPVPAAGPLLSKDPICKILQGVRIIAEAELTIDYKSLNKLEDELIFTQYGLSGSLIFALSRDVSLAVNKEKELNSFAKVVIKLNFIPDLSVSKLQHHLQTLWTKRPGRSVELSLYGLVSAKLAAYITKRVIGSAKKQVKDLSDKERRDLLEALQSTRITIDGTKGWNESEFSCGGVRTSEVNPVTLESSLIKNLYICGELLNIDGNIGGYNLSWAWASGAIAGRLGA